MAKLRVHGSVVAEFRKEGAYTYRVMTDGKWLRSKIGRGWKLAKFKPGINPFNLAHEKQFNMEVKDRQRFDELVKQSTNFLKEFYDTIRPRHDTTQNEENNMAKSVEGKKVVAEKKAAVKAEKPEMLGSKEMAEKLGIEPKRLRTILRAAGEGVSADGEVGRYQWKAGDSIAFNRLKKMVDEYEAKAAEREAKKEEAEAEEKAPKKAKKGKKAKDEEEENEDEEVFEEEEEEVEA